MATWRPDRYGGLRSLLRGSRVPEEVREELEHHITERTAANMARGMSARAAREDALRRFGSLARFSHETELIDQGIEREARRMEVMRTFGRELRLAWRGLVRAPGFSIVAIVTLGLGIGGSVAVYTLLDRAVLSPLPYPAPEQLVRIDHPVPGIGEDDYWSMSTASYFQYEERSSALQDIAVYDRRTANVRTGESATQADVVVTTANLFDVLGARPGMGRLLQESDDRPEAARVAVLSHEYWQTELGGREDIVGATLELEGRPVEIVGVAAAGFSIVGQDADIYVPAQFDRAGPHANSHYLAGIGRMRAGVPLSTVQTELSQLTTELPQAFPSAYYPGFMEDARFGVRVRDLQAVVVGDVARLLWIALAAVLLVLVIACANVANLFLVRNEARQSELTIRRALGASRAHTLVHAFAEAFSIAAVAGALGLWLAYGGLRLVIAMAPVALPRVGEASLDSAAMLFAGGLVLLSAAVFALFPLLRRVDWSLLREGVRGSTASRRQLRGRDVLVTAQIALAVMLLSAAGLMLRSFAGLRSTDTGLDADNVLTVSISLPGMPYGREPGVATSFWSTLSQRALELPGVQQVSGTNDPPVFNENTGCAVMAVNPPAARSADLGCVPRVIVTPGYFETLGIPVDGRAPTWDDIRNGSGAVVISRGMADVLWPGEDAIGRGLRVPNDGDAYYRIVGIADDVRQEGAHKPAPPMVYYPIEAIEGAPLWGPRTSLVVLVRTAGLDPVQLTSSIRELARDIEPAAALAEVQTMPEVIAHSMARTTFTMMLLGVAGTMALILSIVGLYGVVAYTVSRRHTEIGVRMALGANAARVGGMIVLESLRVAAAGVVLGLIGAAFATSALRSLLFGVEPTDGLTLATVALLLLVVTAVASFIPARRAARVDPLESLRG